MLLVNNYQISFEAIRNGFIKTQPELNMNNRNSSARKDVLPSYIVEFIHWNNELSKNPSLMEGDFCSIETLYNLVGENDLIICLGLGCKSIDKIIDGIRTNDIDSDYTKEWTDEQIKNHFYNIEKEDKSNYEFCLKNNINYYDTYENRNDVFNNIIENLK